MVRPENQSCRLKRRTEGRAILILPLLILLLIAAGSARMARFALIRQTDLKGKSFVYLFIPTGADLPKVTSLLISTANLRSPQAFEWLAGRKHYAENIKPGRYRILQGLRNNQLINLLRSGQQEPVKITIRNFRSPDELAGRIGKALETDSATLSGLFRDSLFLKQYGLTPATLFILFIPDTYQFNWNTSAPQLFQRMQREYFRFWNPERLHKADSLRLTLPEVVTLASIIEKETNFNKEKPRMAGVYLNRLNRDIPLQADPTIIFAWNDYSIRRVLNYHLQIPSRYNTYLHTGLPPGPICIPSIASVDAVLHAERHDFLYFCAREDLSGQHSFARTLAEHNANARRYQKSLNQLNIKN